MPQQYRIHKTSVINLGEFFNRESTALIIETKFCNEGVLHKKSAIYSLVAFCIS